MTLAVLKVDLKCKSVARLSGNERLRRCTRRASRPAFARFDAWSLIGWSQAGVDFIGRFALECRVGAMLIVPSEAVTDVSLKLLSALQKA